MRYVLRPLGILILAFLFFTPAAVRAGNIANPIIWATPTEGEVAAIYWPDGADITLSVDDPGNGPGVDYQATETAGPAYFDDQITLAIFDLDGVMDVVPGLELTMTDGVTTKMHTVTDVTATNVDTAAETVSGTAEPGSDVRVEAWQDPLDAAATRFEVADGSGNWTADFSTPGGATGEEDTFDIDEMSAGPALQMDDDGDVTAYYWSGSGGDGDHQTQIIAIPAEDRIEALNWPLDAEVTLTIDGTSPEFTDSATTHEAGFDPNQTIAVFELGGTFDLIEGHDVTVTDGVTTKMLTIDLATITSINPAADTVSGTASPDASVGVDVAIPPMSGVHRHEIADSSGKWTADFSAPGDEGGEDQTADIVFGQNLELNIGVEDEDGDVSVIHQPIAPATGDVNCSGGVDPVDALGLLRFDAGLSVSMPTGCPAIGSY